MNKVLYSYTSDKQLCKDIANGNKNSESFLVNKYNEKLLNGTYGRLKKFGKIQLFHTYGEDIVNDIWIIIFEKISAGYYDEKRGELGAYIMGILHKSFYSRLKKYLNEAPPPYSLIYLTKELEEKAQRNEIYEDDNENILIEKIFKLIHSLKDKYTIVIIMRLIEQKSYKNISEKLGIPESTARWRFAHALNKIKLIIEKQNKKKGV